MRSPFFRGRIVPCWRPEWIEGTGGGGTMNHAWLVWAREGTGATNIYVSREEAVRELGEKTGVPGAGSGKARRLKPGFLKPRARRRPKPAAQLELPLSSDAGVEDEIGAENEIIIEDEIVADEIETDADADQGAHP